MTKAEATVGIEPTRGGFADRSVPTSPGRHDASGPTRDPEVVQERVTGLDTGSDVQHPGPEIRTDAATCESVRCDPAAKDRLASGRVGVAP